MFWFGFFVVVAIVCFSRSVSSRQNSKNHLENYQKDPFSKDITLIVQLASKERFDEAANVAKAILELEPTHFDANQLYGSILLNLQQYEESIKYFERGFSIAMPAELAMYRNYIEALRMAGRVELASSNAARILDTFGNSKTRADDVPFLLAYAKVEQDMGNATRAIHLAEQAVNVDPSSLTAWLVLMEILTVNQNFTAAESIAYQYLDNFPPNADILSRLGISLQFQRRLNEALVAFQEAEKLKPDMPFILSCLGAVYQELGLSLDAYYYFEKAIPLLPYDAPIRNNFGALLGSMGFQREELYWLKEAVTLTSSLSQANMNLAGHYQDEGNISMAIHYFNIIPNNTNEKVNVDIRVATILSPISLSWDEMELQRHGMKEALLGILQRPQIVSSCDGSLDRLPFYISFHGLNDRPLQDLLGKVYRYRLKEAGWYSLTVLQPNNFIQRLLTQESSSLPQLLQAAPSESSSLPSFFPRKIRIGFISKFFGVFEPHGMLLDGIMKYLPRSQFHVVCFFVARTDFKVVAPRIQEACDEHHQLSLTIQHVIDHMNSVELDALLFADVISEPINHFLTHMRFAPIQIAFWGNPITTGSQTIDYFLSADIMEHPYRTRIPKGEDAYSEQVWLMEGQGIWYFKPVDPNIEIEKANMSHLVGKTKYYTRADFQLPEKSSNVFLYLLPQSTFKIHPLYDLVLREILAKDERIHIAVTGGRRPSWTARYMHRLRYNLGETYASRLHLMERVSSENFHSLLSLADGVLHPFPFDGSRTSADALQVFVPFVTLPTEYLRGRMGFSFYRTMNISELVAMDVQDYIDIAVKLASDEKFYLDMKARIRERVDLIWEDMTVPYHATQFLQRVFSLPVSRSYETYLRLDSGRYVSDGPSNGFIDQISEDIQKSKLREQYQSAFDLTYGEKQRQRRKYTYKIINPKRIDENPLNGAWELDDETHIASLEGFSEGRWPRIFEHWRNFRQAERRPLYILPSDRIPPVPSHLNESEPFNPFPLKLKIRNASSFPSSVLEENSTHKKKLDQQRFSQQLTEEPQHRPLNVQLIEEANIITSSQMSSSFLPTNAPIVIDLTTNSLPVEGIPQTSEPAKQRNASSSIQDTNFYSYGIMSGSERAQKLIEQMQFFRGFVRRGHYDDALHILFNLENSGHILPVHDAVFHIEKGMIHLHREEIPLALQHCRTARALDALMVNALGCIGVALTYSSDKTERKEGSLVLLQAVELHQKKLLQALNDMKKQFPLEANEQSLADKIDDEILSGSGSSVVSMPLDSLLFSYVASLVNLEEFELCVDTMVKFFNLPAIEKGGSHIVVMAQIAWSKIGEQIIQQAFSRDIPVMKHVHYLQKHASFLLSNFGLCLSLSKYGDLYSAAFKDIVHIIEKIHKQHDYFALREFSSKGWNEHLTPQQLPLIRSIDKSPAAVTVLTQYFRTASSETQKVIDYVLYKNLANPAIDEVHILTEEDFTEELIARFPTSLLSKVRQKVIGERLTFATAFQYANDFLMDRLVAVTNADIYFDESLYRLLYASQHLNLSASVFSSDHILSADTSLSKKQQWQYRSFPTNTVLALLRWQHQHNTQGEISLSLRTDSQDAWIFRPPLDPRLLSASNFPLGVPRCDNRLAYLFEALNYTVLNPAFDIHAIEYQTSTSGLRTGLYRMKDSVPGAVETLLVNDILEL